MAVGGVGAVDIIDFFNFSGARERRPSGKDGRHNDTRENALKANSEQLLTLEETYHSEVLDKSDRTLDLVNGKVTVDHVAVTKISDNQDKGEDKQLDYLFVFSTSGIEINSVKSGLIVIKKNTSNKNSFKNMVQAQAAHDNLNTVLADLQTAYPLVTPPTSCLLSWGERVYTHYWVDNDDVVFYTEQADVYNEKSLMELLTT